MIEVTHEWQPGQISAFTRGKCSPVARKYGVAPRAVRDVWNRKTWAYATKQLWPLERTLLQSLNLDDEATGLTQMEKVRQSCVDIAFSDN
jgi:hypothetical protein